MELLILGLLLFWFVIWLTLTVGWTVMPSAPALQASTAASTGSG